MQIIQIQWKNRKAKLIVAIWYLKVKMVRNSVDRIQTFPQDMERYTVSLVENRKHVISVMIHGDQSEKNLRNLAEKVREDLLKEENITQIELTGSGLRAPAVAEVPL